MLYPIKKQLPFWDYFVSQFQTEVSSSSYVFNIKDAPYVSKESLVCYIIPHRNFNFKCIGLCLNDLLSASFQTMLHFVFPRQYSTQGMLLFPFLKHTGTNIKYKIFCCKLETSRNIVH